MQIFGQIIKKEVVLKGINRKNPISNIAKAKKAIEDFFDLRTSKFRRFIIDNISNVKINNNIFIIDNNKI